MKKVCEKNDLNFISFLKEKLEELNTQENKFKDDEYLKFLKVKWLYSSFNSSLIKDENFNKDLILEIIDDFL